MTDLEAPRDPLRDAVDEIRSQTNATDVDRAAFLAEVHQRRDRRRAAARRRHVVMGAAAALIVAGALAVVVGADDPSQEPVETATEPQAETTVVEDPGPSTAVASATYLPDGFTYQRIEVGPDGAETYVRYDSDLPGSPYIEIVTIHESGAIPPLEDARAVAVGDVEGRLGYTFPETPEAGLKIVSWEISEGIEARVIATGSLPDDELIAVAAGAFLDPRGRDSAHEGEEEPPPSTEPSETTAPASPSGTPSLQFSSLPEGVEVNVEEPFVGVYGEQISSVLVTLSDGATISAAVTISETATDGYNSDKARGTHPATGAPYEVVTVRDDVEALYAEDVVAEVAYEAYRWLEDPTTDVQVTGANVDPAVLLDAVNALEVQLG
jgi:hypothetical protein